MNPSGGLRWHWRAWRQQAAWSPTRQAIAAWLASCQVQSRQLLLLGPSAGWMLPTAWLLRFESVTAVDMDPWAARIFALRHGRHLSAAGVRWHYRTQDALATLPALLAEQPEACVFFDNLLGQLRFHAPRALALQDTAALEAKLQTLIEPLAGREWGSLHDLVSGPVARFLVTEQFGMSQKVEIVNSAIFPAVQACMAGEKVASGLFPVGAKSPWLDHLTGQLFPKGTPVQRMAWPFSRRYSHVLEAGWVKPGAQVTAGRVESRTDAFVLF